MTASPATAPGTAAERGGFRVWCPQRDRGRGRVDYRVLGPIQAVGVGGRVDLGPPKRRALLALLLVNAGKSLPVDRVLDALWHEGAPAGGAKTLQVHVSKLRASLRAGLAPDEPQPIETNQTGYRLGLEPEDIDSGRLHRALAVAAAAVDGDPAAAERVLATALDAVAGTPYEDVAHEDFAQGEIRRLEELVLAADELRIDAALRLGRAAEMVPDLERIVADHPHRERSWAMLMLALHRTGRQADALRAYSRAAHVLGEELGIEPGQELRRLEEQILLQDPELDGPTAAYAATPLAAAPVRPGNLPSPLTAFVGRSTELESVVRLLSGSRLVTLTGSGGSGKTRVAIEVARRVDLPDGSWLVRLGKLRQPSGLAAAVCETLGFSSRDDTGALDVVVHELRHRRLMLVLDNCEHVIEAAAEFVEAVTSAAPGVSVLATSREPLQLSGEVVARLLPMRMPLPGSGLAGLRDSDSGTLLIDRAFEAGYDIDEDEAEAAIRLCRAVEGVPLAVELAAAKLRSMSLTEVVDRLNDRFALLVEHQRTAEDHQATLEGAVEWSYELLTPEEQEVFCRLSVFCGGWSLDAAEAVVGGGIIDRRDVARILARLVDKSLVIADRDREDKTRYVMLETLRQFAEARLTEADPVHARHLGYLIDLAERRNDGDPVWFERLDVEGDNLRAALGWAVERSGEAERVLRVIAALGAYFASRDRVVQPVRWVDAVAGAVEKVAPGVAAPALAVAGDLALIAGDVGEAARWHGEAAELAAAAGIPDARVRAVRGLGRVALERGHRETAAEHFEEAFRLAEDIGDGRMLAECLVDLAAVVARARQDDLLTRALGLHASLGSIGGEAGIEVRLGWLRYGRGDLDAARRSFARARTMALDASDTATAAAAAIGSGDVARTRGDWDVAADDYRDAARLGAVLGTPHLSAVTSGRLGDLARRSGDTRDARRRLAQSLGHWRQLPRQPGRAATLLALAALDLAEGRIDLAKHHAEDALGLWSHLGRHDGEGWGRTVLASVLVAAGEDPAPAAVAAVKAYRAHLRSSAVLDPWLAPEAGDPAVVLEACRIAAADGHPAVAESLAAARARLEGGNDGVLELLDDLLALVGDGRVSAP